MRWQAGAPAQANNKLLWRPLCVRMSMRRTQRTYLFRPSRLSLAVTRRDLEAIPLVTTTLLLAPISVFAGTSRIAETTVVTGGYSHRAIVVGPGIEDMASGLVDNAYQRIVNRHRGIVPLIRAHRKAVRLRPRDLVRSAPGERSRNPSDHGAARQG